MRTGASYLRIFGFMTLAFFLLEFIIDSGNEWAIIKYPVIWAVLGMLFIISIAIEIIIETLTYIFFNGMQPEAKERFITAQKHRKEQRWEWLRKGYASLLGNKPLEEEKEIVLDHNYDGIRELDNTLPPWWVYLFYATILFAVVYMLRYHVFNGIDQKQEYEIEMAQAKEAIEAYKSTAKNLVDANTVELLTNASDLNAGKVIFEINCVACHKADGGGGIGPNLTDDYWILGGGIKNVFSTVSEGGRAGKGMVAWKTELTPAEMAQVSSYLLTMQGTTPAEPKAPEGDLWVDPDAVNEGEAINVKTTESDTETENVPK